MTLRDRDLVSLQEARELAASAAVAQQTYSRFSQEQVDFVVDACAKAAAETAPQLARTAVEETGFGNVPDKITKNRLAAVDLHRAIRTIRTVGIIGEDRQKGILEVATPVGVVAAVIPSTNPTSTAIYKTLISLKARNAIVLSPHPTAVRCIRETANVLIHAALSAGAPEGLISCMENPTLQGTQELMRQRSIGVILATGGTGLVRAAYSSGKPAYGVGPGNVPAFIERTADVRKAIADIFAGKTFDYGTICSSEQSIVAEEAIAAQALEECKRQGAYFLSPEETKKVGEMVYRPGAHTPNPKIVGRPATLLAEMAGIQVPASTRVLIARLQEVGRDHPLSAEKLSPILALYVVPNLAGGIEMCTRLLQFGGLGHTVAIHSQNESAVREFGQAVPAFRVCVNTSAVHGSIGYSTNLFPAMTLGCGAAGGNITSDNISPLHLMNVKRIAWESRGVEHRTVPASERMTASYASAGSSDRRDSIQGPAQEFPSGGASSTTPASPTPAVLPDRATIARVVEQVFAHYGIPRGGARPTSQPVSGSAPGWKAGKLPTEQSSQSERPAVRPPTIPINAAVPPSSEIAPPARVLQVAAFVSEVDARQAMARGEKIYIGPRTIVTPSARDFASTNDVFVETGLAPTP